MSSVSSALSLQAADDGEGRPLLPPTSHAAEKGETRGRGELGLLETVLTFRYLGIGSQLFCGLMIVYMLRVNLSVAIVPMSTAFGWDEGTRGVVLSSFFWGYIVMQVPGGWLATRFGGKTVFQCAVFGSALFTVLLPLVAKYYWLLIACRVATGLCEAASYPAIHALLSHWAPPEERSRLGTFIWAGAYLGTVVSMIISPVIVDAWGWPALFYSFGAAGGLWVAVWQIFGASSPEQSRWIGKREQSFLREAEARQHLDNLEETTAKESKKDSTPWIKILSSTAFWAIAVTHFSTNWFFYISLTWLPTYLDQALHFSLKRAGFVSFLPYLVMFFVVMAVGHVADALITRRQWRVRNVRKILQGSGSMVPAACLIVLAVWTHLPSPYYAVALLTLAVGSSGLCLAGYGVNHLDISPRYAGVLMGLTNTGATLPGIFGVMLTGWILEATNSWPLVFLIAAGINTAATVFFVIFARGEVCIE